MDDDLGGATVIDRASGFEDTVSLIDLEPIGDITDTGRTALQCTEDDAPTSTRTRRVTPGYEDWPVTPPSHR
ncbi:MAG: hypothetical protein SFX73_16175 [Kofleriaceae bacterium]|nr:hypothetical protein [Kofleriaceae bacterium]